MRKGLLACAIAAACLTRAIGADVLSQLGITPQLAKMGVDSILNSGLSNPGIPAKAFKLLAPAQRAQVAAAGVAWLKAYTGTADFKQEYAKIRQNRKPEAPTFQGTPEEEVSRASADQTKQMADSKKMLESLPPDQRQQIEAAMKAAQDMMKAQDTPETRKMRVDGIKRSRDGQMQTYQQDLAKWQIEFPEDSKPVVVRRLKEFLTLSGDVDFTAKLAPQGQFQNPAYESKPDQWKMCYRAGKDATTAARAAVQTWLKELGA
jgi:hypothetical protein